MNLRTFIGSKIKEYRKAIKMTTLELGELSETSQSTISEIERGTRAIEIEKLIKICNSLGVTLNDVIPPEILKKQLKVSNAPEINQLLNLVNSFSSEEIRLLIGILLKINKLPKQDRKNLPSLLHSLMNKK
jgi:transcriptional regulator with XRE-family HTH domain